MVLLMASPSPVPFSLVEKNGSNTRLTMSGASPGPSRPDHGLTVWDASSSARTLAIMLVVVLVFLPVVLAYTAWVFRVLRGRITLESVRQHSGLY